MRFSIFCAMYFMLAPGAVADEEPGDSETHIKELIAQLVSPNEAPEVRGRPSAKYPVGYDKEAQKQVLRARSELNRLGLKAFPFLFERFDDKRYCMTMDDGPADANHTVGRACRGIVRCRLEPYNNFGFTRGEDDPRTRPRRPTYSGKFLGHPTEALKWWETHADKSLVELQIEVLEWVIAEEERQKDKYSEKEQEFLADTLTRLKETNEALKPSVPWAR